jgi:GT2 family glycosyltransferase
VTLGTGEFISLFDHDDLLWPTALLEVAKALNEDSSIDFIYTDEDKITEDTRHHLGPFFKPDWNLEFLHSVNYITHFSTVRRELFEKLGGLDPARNGAQDWDFFLRVARETDRIYHIPKILYSWRTHDLSTAKSTDAKPYVVKAQEQAIMADLEARGYPDAEVKRDAKHSGYWVVRYPLREEPLISIVIPSKNQYKIVKRCIDSIYKKTTYINFEIILVDTGSDDPKVHKWYESVQKQHDNFHVINWVEKPFSYARSCNEGAKHAKGKLLVMLNNDTEVLTPDWLETLASDALRPEVGAVGPLLFFPDGYHIQHAGVGVGLGGVAANSFSMMTLEQPLSQTQHLYINTRHEMTVVTAACLMMRKEVFDEIGGFDEKYRVTYNDVDLCLRIYEKGYRNIYTPHARLLHHESISVGLPEELAKRDTKEMREAMKQFKSQWRKYVEHDPNLNPQLDKTNAFYDISIIHNPTDKKSKELGELGKGLVNVEADE